MPRWEESGGGEQAGEARPLHKCHQSLGETEHERSNQLDSVKSNDYILVFVS